MGLSKLFQNVVSEQNYSKFIEIKKPVQVEDFLFDKKLFSKDRTNIQQYARDYLQMSDQSHFQYRISVIF